MKRQYITPTTCCLNVSSERLMISASNGTTINSDNVGDFDYSKKDNDWDIWD